MRSKELTIQACIGQNGFWVQVSEYRELVPDWYGGKDRETSEGLKRSSDYMWEFRGRALDYFRDQKISYEHITSVWVVDYSVVGFYCKPQYSRDDAEEDKLRNNIIWQAGSYSGYDVGFGRPHLFCIDSIDNR